MKTLHIDTGREMGGGQWQALYLIERLPDAKLIARAGSPLLDEARRRGIEVSSSFPSLGSEDASLIHAHDARAHTVALVSSALALKRTPLVVSRRVGFPIRTGFASRQKYLRARLYLAVSQFVAARLRDAGVPEECIRVVYDGVPVPPKSSTLEPGRVVALASKPVEIPGIPVHLATNLWEDLATASIFVYASAMEGLGSAALAAMAAGVPVVATPAGGLPEAVEHERTGLVVPADEIGAAVRRLIDHPQEAAEMGRRGRERVQQKFSQDAMVEATLRAYHEVVECSK
jgi:hypothetical protein